MTLLFNACPSGNKDLEENIVKHGADINKDVKWNGETLLLKAIENGNKDIVEYLKNHGADINEEDLDGETPLFKSDNEDLVEGLIKNVVDINKANNYWSYTIILCVSMSKLLYNKLFTRTWSIYG